MSWGLSLLVLLLACVSAVDGVSAAIAGLNGNLNSFKFDDAWMQKIRLITASYRGLRFWTNGMMKYRA